MPFVSPETVIGDDPPVAVNPPGEEVTVYPVIAAPPLLAGAVKDTAADPLPATAETLVGAPGTVFGVTAVDALEATELPAAFVATTVKV